MSYCNNTGSTSTPAGLLLHQALKGLKDVSNSFSKRRGKYPQLQQKILRFLHTISCLYNQLKAFELNQLPSSATKPRSFNIEQLLIDFYEYAEGSIGLELFSRLLFFLELLMDEILMKEDIVQSLDKNPDLHKLLTEAIEQCNNLNSEIEEESKPTQVKSPPPVLGQEAEKSHIKDLIIDSSSQTTKIGLHPRLLENLEAMTNRDKGLLSPDEQPASEEMIATLVKLLSRLTNLDPPQLRPSFNGKHIDIQWSGKFVGILIPNGKLHINLHAERSQNFQLPQQLEEAVAFLKRVMQPK